jgi:hypothetical protein
VTRTQRPTALDFRAVPGAPIDRAHRHWAEPKSTYSLFYLPRRGVSHGSLPIVGCASLLPDDALATQRDLVVTGPTESSLPSTRKADARAVVDRLTLDEFAGPGSQDGGRRATQELASASDCPCRLVSRRVPGGRQRGRRDRPRGAVDRGSRTADITSRLLHQSSSSVLTVKRPGGEPYASHGNTVASRNPRFHRM